MTLSTHPRPRLALPPALRPRTTCHTPVSRGRGPTLSSEGSRRGGRQQARDSRRTCILATLGRRPPSIRLHITLSERVPATGAPLPAFSCWPTIGSLWSARAPCPCCHFPVHSLSLRLQVQPAHPRAARPRPCGRQHGRRHVPSGGISSMLGGGLQRRQQSAWPAACGARRGR